MTMNNRIALVLMCALITQEANVCAGPVMSRVAQDLMDQCDKLNDKEKMMIIASSMVVTAIGSVVYQNSIMTSSAQIDRDDQFELELEQASLESLADSPDFDFEKYSETSDTMPLLEYACDTMNIQDRILVARAILDVNEWSQQPIDTTIASVRTIPPVRGSDTYNFRIAEKK